MEEELGSGGPRSSKIPAFSLALYAQFAHLKSFCRSLASFVGVVVWATGRVYVGYGAPVYACVGVGDAPPARGDGGAAARMASTGSAYV